MIEKELSSIDSFPKILQQLGLSHAEVRSQALSLLFHEDGGAQPVEPSPCCFPEWVELRVKLGLEPRHRDMDASIPTGSLLSDQIPSPNFLSKKDKKIFRRNENCSVISFLNLNAITWENYSWSYNQHITTIEKSAKETGEKPTQHLEITEYLINPQMAYF